MTRLRNAIAIALVLTLLTSQSALAAGKTSLTIKKAGRATTITPNTILSGSGIPPKSIGIEGDFYIDIKGANLYGPKTKGVWKIATSLRVADSKDLAVPTVGADGVRGDRGEQGLPGAKGATGDRGLAGSAGINGTQGATGLTGAAGTAGANGTPGINGAAGSIGAAGSAGANGTQGATGGTGLTGATGTQGAAGSTGATGSTGTNVANGATGSAGISNSYFVDIQQWTLSTASNSGTSDSALFGSLVSGGSYAFEIMLDGTFSPTSTASMTIGMQLIPSITPTSIQYRVFASDSTTFINGFGGRHYQFLVIGTIVCAVGTTSLTMRAVDQNGATSANMLSFTGKALINKVGAIG